ncbi:MAG: ABC transporter substrate-binding protein [Alphaproteobacteria bacterium]|nr:ABC transporter substrate-binding protein [Alphaproteobacteria bacterium]
MSFIGKPLAASIVAATLAAGISGAAAQSPQRGGVLNSTLWPEPPGIVIGINLNAPTLLPSSKMFEGLLTYDFRMAPQPMLAESWEVSPDGLTYTFKLRRNATWHDGKPFTADDVVFSVGEFIPATHARSKPTFERVKASAPDPHTVVMRLSEPYAPLIRSFDALSAPMVPAHVYRGTDFRANPANQSPVGTGPFKFKEWRKGEYIHLVRNDAYWQAGRPYLDAIYYRFIPDSASRALALESGQVQLATQTDIEFVDVARLGKLPNLKVTTQGWEWNSTISWIEMNIRRKPFDDPRFRRAVLHALDREFIRTNLFFGLAKVPTGPIHSSSPYYDADVPRYPYDPAKAAALLDEMGLKPGPDGVRARVKLMGLPYGELWNRLSEYIRQSLGKVGVAVTLEATDVAGWGNRFANWDYDMTTTFLSTLSDPALGVARTYITANQRKGVLFTNTSGYSNPRVDELFAKAAGTSDDAQRKAMYSEMQKIVAGEAAIAWLVEIDWPTIHDARLRDAVVNAFGPNDNFAGAWLAK